MPNRFPSDQHIWNASIFILFPILVVLLYRYFDSSGAMQAFYSLTIFDIVIISLATFRFIRLIAFDKIFSFGRAIFHNTLPDGTMVKPPKGFRRAMAELLECSWCVGVWAALLVLTFYIISPLGRFFALILAIAALGTFFQVVSKRVGAGTANHPESSHLCS